MTKINIICEWRKEEKDNFNYKRKNRVDDSLWDGIEGSTMLKPLQYNVANYGYYAFHLHLP